jgi:small-conductance mechanosensitive channel/CRP-like cAMP-binding protein
MVDATSNTAYSKSLWRSAFQTLVLPLILFVILFAVRAYWPTNVIELGVVLNQVAVDQGGKLLTTLCWIAFGFLFNRTCFLLIWRGLFVRAGINVPGMLVTLAEIVIWLTTFAVVITGVYGQSVTALLATSTVLIGVAGFAVQKLIADFFSGIVLGIENPYALGDWLEVEPGDMVGKVVEFNWRSTRIETPESIIVVVPNSHLVSNVFKNISRPHSYFRDVIEIPLGFEVTTHQGQRILLSAVNQIDEIASLPVKPSVTISKYDNRGVVWLLQYWVPDRGRLSKFRFMVHQNILRNLHYAGLSIAMPIKEMRRAATVDDDVTSSIVRLLHQSELFSGLQPEETRHLATGAMQRLYYANEPILKQGRPGSSLFILNEGLLAVWVSAENGVEQQVARIHPGEFFGELSLLTGATRGATVIPITDCLITEIGKDVMSELLSLRPELADVMSRVLAERQSANARNLVLAEGSNVVATKEGIARQILGQVKLFFNLKSH